MTAVDPPVQQEARPRVPAIEARAEDIKTTSTTTDNSQRLGLTSGSPQDTLKLLSDLTRSADQSMPAVFGRFDLAFNGTDLSGMFSPQNKGLVRPDQLTDGVPRPTDAALRRGDNPQDLPPGVSRVERTRITGTGSGRDTQVEIRYGMDGQPNFVRDHLGEWTSKDGGKTWKTEEPASRVRRGEVSIDAKGNYSYENTDYGIKSTFSPDGKVTRTITDAAGDQFAVTRDKKGVPIGFTDKTGDWTGDGKNWTNTKTNETKTGTVALTEFGEFRFKPNKGDAVVAQTPQLERINKLQDEICRDFGIIFAKPGEKKKNEDRDPNSPPEAQLYAGVPTEAELNTLKEVLKNTDHENYKGMKVWFVRPDENDQVATYGFYHPHGENQPQGDNCGKCCGSKAALQDAKNGEMVILPLARQEVNGFGGLEGTLYHEFGHHEQKLGVGMEMLGPESKPEGKKLAAEMGWQWSKRLNEPVLEDKTGGLWRWDEQGNKYRWAGGHQPEDGKHRLNPEQMRDRAKVTPINGYFNAPEEMHAEALAGFRTGESNGPKGGRNTLAIDSPQLYDTIKRYDQEHIDKKYGKTPGGESKFIRGLDGKVIENNAENRNAIQAKEEQWKIEHANQKRLPRRDN